MDNNIKPIINNLIETIILHIEYKKIVSFNESHNTIFMIQSNDDTDYYLNKCDLWWSKLDYSQFQLLAKHEVLYFIEFYKINLHINLSVKEAIVLLYQP